MHTLESAALVATPENFVGIRHEGGVSRGREVLPNRNLSTDVQNLEVAAGSKCELQLAWMSPESEVPFL